MFEQATLQEIIDRIANDFLNRIEGSSTLLRRSVLSVMSKVYGGACLLMYENISDNAKQLFATTAESSFLELIGSEIGISRNVGVKSSGSGSGTGTNGTTIPAGTVLQSSSGNEYTTDSAVTIAGGVYTVAITASEYGDYDEDAGAELSFVNPIAGVNTTYTVDSSGITGGVAEESDDDYRDRILDRKRQPPHGGASFDYIKWALEVSGVTRAWSIPLYYGVGTIGLAFVRDDDDDLIPSEAERATVESYIKSHTDPITGETVGIPVTAEPGFFVIPISKLTVNFTIGVYPNTAAVQASIESRLSDLFLSDGGPGQTIAISRIYEAITSAVGETYTRIELPIADVTAAVNQVHVLGDVTFEDY